MPMSGTRGQRGGLRHEGERRSRPPPTPAATRGRGPGGGRSQPVPADERPRTRCVAECDAEPVAKSQLAETKRSEREAHHNQRRGCSDPQVEPEREGQINPPGRDRASRDAQEVGGAEAPGDHVLELKVLRHANRLHDQAATAVATAVATVRTVATVPCTTGLWLSR